MTDSVAGTAPPSDPDMLAFVNEILTSSIPQMANMGITIEELAPGHVVASAPYEGNTNHLGSIYAGVLFSVAEVLGGAICAPSFDLTKFAPTVKSVTIDFKRPARSAVRASVRLSADEIARIGRDAEESGKGVFVLEAELVDSDGTLVAVTHGDYQLRRV